MGSCSKKGTRGKGLALLYRVERCLNFLKLLSLCPIFWHELHELHELPLLIKHLQRERRKTKHELHELLFIIKDLRANRVDLVRTRWTWFELGGLRAQRGRGGTWLGLRGLGAHGIARTLPRPHPAKLR